MAAKPEVKPKAEKISRSTPGWEETVMDLIIKFAIDESGAPAVEYALLLSFIAVGIAASLTTFGAAVRGLFQVNLPP